MKRFRKLLPIYILAISPLLSSAQVDQNQTGAWYMYFWNTSLKDSPWGFQGDIQYRNWNLGGDLEQLLLRGGLTYKPLGTDVKLTLGYGHITTGEFGDGDATSVESRMYQEALLPQKVGNRIYLTHRFRFEQRFVEDQDFRTRGRYNLFVTIPLNQQNLQPGAIYLALYNELFINGQKTIGENKQVEYFDRNRLYAAIGYTLKKGMKVQLGIMRQTLNTLAKNQIQLSFHHTF